MFSHPMQFEPAIFASHTRNGDLVHGELYGAAVEDVPASVPLHCRLEVVQLEQGASCCDLNFVTGAAAAVCQMRVVRPLHLRGSVKNGWIGLGLVHGDTPAGGSAKGARDDLLHLGLPNAPFDWYLRAGQSLLLGMAGHDAVLELASEAHAEKGVRKAIGMGDKISRLRLDPTVVAEQRTTLLDLLENARRGELADNGAAFARSVLEAMVLLLDAAEDAGPARGSAEILVRRACSLVGETPKRFSISHLSGELRVSPRTLYNAFVEITGVGPHAYFLRQRLNAARHQLAAADPHRGTVTNVALDLGFTELGRFAVRYRDFFGETPSQTLQRRPPRMACRPA